MQSLKLKGQCYHVLNNESKKLKLIVLKMDLLTFLLYNDYKAALVFKRYLVAKEKFGKIDKSNIPSITIRIIGYAQTCFRVDGP